MIKWSIYVWYELWIMWKCDRKKVFFKKGNIVLRLFRICIELDIHLEEYILTLLVYWNHINEDYQVVRAEGDSYDWVYDLKDNWSRRSCVDLPYHMNWLNSYVHVVIWRDNTLNVIWQMHLLVKFNARVFWKYSQISMYVCQWIFYMSDINMIICRHLMV